MKPIELPKIDKGIPIQKRDAKTQQRMEFIKTLEVGDSFELNKEDRKLWWKVLYDDKSELKFTVLKQEDGKYRVWRIK